LAAALKPTVPLPLPFAPLLIVTHPESDEAVQAHPLAAVTLIVPEPPAVGTDWLAGEMLGEQGEVPA
jgi:hypothetical protein